MFRWSPALRVAILVLIGLIALVLYWQIARVRQPDDPIPVSPAGRDSSPTAPEAPQREGAAFVTGAARRVGSPDANARLVVRAVDRAGGTPIQEAEIRLLEIDPRSGKELEYRSAYTDEYGEVRFDPPDGSFLVRVHHPQYLPLREPVDLEATGTLRKRFEMIRGVSVSGLVTDQRQRPIPRVAIGFSGVDGTRVEAAGAGDGSFQTWLPPGRYDVVAFSRGGEAVLYGVEIWPGREFFIEIGLGEVSPSITFTGKVEANQGPVSEAILRVERTRRQSEPPEGGLAYKIAYCQSAKTGPDGRFTMRVPRMATAQLTITAAGYETWRQRIDLKQPSPHAFRLQEERGFHAKVVDVQGKVVPGSEIVGLNFDGQPVLQVKGRFVYASSEYPLKICARDRQTGLQITETVLVPEYQPEVLLQVTGR